MKTNKFYILFLSICFLTPCTAKTGESETEITLPDVSTVLQGGSLTAGKTSVPDFSQVLPKDEAPFFILPKLPENSDLVTSSVPENAVTTAKSKEVYADGTVGAGFPGLFSGKFSIYRQSGSNPFQIDFYHENVNGYAGNSLTSGYFDRNTLVQARQSFIKEKMNWNFGGGYTAAGEGLQNKFANISEVNRQKIDLFADWKILIPKGFSFSAGINGNLYNRYAVITGNPTPSIADYAKEISILSLSPDLIFSWKMSGFYSDFNAKYNLEYDFKDVFGSQLNRAEFGTSLGWANKYINIYGKGSAVIGNKIGNNSAVVPFTIGIDCNFKTPLSSRAVYTELKGGMKSLMQPVQILEDFYKFSALEDFASETSYWYADFSSLIPVKDTFSVSILGEFKKTAMGNGVWEASYTPAYFAFGQYKYIQHSNIELNTGIEFSLAFGLFNLTSGWKSFWIDLPVLSDAHTVYSKLGVQSKNAAFGGECGFSLAVSEKTLPVIDISVFWKLKDSVRIAVSVEDIVKLLTGTERDYAGSYISRSGMAAILAKFSF